MRCNGTKVDGNPCSLNGSPRFGGRYCHHHCSEYYAGQRTKVEEQMKSQEDLIHSLTQQLSGVSDKKEFDRITNALNLAHKSMFKSFKDLADMMAKQGEVMCEMVREQGEKTRETVLSVGDKQSEQMYLLGMMMTEVNNKVSSLGPVEDERRKFIEGPLSYDRNHPLAVKWNDMMGRVSFKDITEGEFNCYIERFLDEEYVTGSTIRTIVRDNTHVEHTPVAHLYSDLLKGCDEQAKIYGRSDLVDAADRCLFEITEPPRNIKRKVCMIEDTATPSKKQKIVD